ncbi:MAG TPA: sigma 54-interacting transcriptional regulator [Patescibacteria group bacterium]|nr:sigma 54-interacting transcriptional regulator [Patescibacteria group bacterium]
MDCDIESLKQYYDLSQRVAEAIEAVLRIDVTIMNGEMKRISGTGKYKALIGEKIEENSAFDYCLRTGDPQVIVDHSDDNSICKVCPRSKTCAEKAEICVPIKQGNTTVGVIGVIAFDDEQKNRIVSNEPVFINFLEKMSDLLEAKYSEHQINQEKKLLSSRLVCALDTINAGIVLYDKNGDVFYKNKALVKVLSEIGIIHYDSFVKEIWGNTILQEILAGKEYPDPCEITVQHNGEKYALLASISYLKTSSESSEIILTLQNINKLRKQIIQSIARSQVKLQFENILGVAENFLEAKRLAEKAAMTESNVMIYGESGTGKELFARAIHNHSKRLEQAFVPINCGAIPDELLESELFGYEKGAFTGAYANKIGKFEVADNGTVFLDEISEMPYRLQVKLLRAIQEREICRLGSNKIQKVNVKIVAATNTDLLQCIKDGLFRKDLYYRLNVIPIYIPPLRERKDDIIYLARHFIQHYAGMLNKGMKDMSADVISLFLKYPWPGNVRELQSVIEYAVSFETGETIGLEFIEKRLKLNHDRSSLNISHDIKNLEAALRDYEKEALESSIKKYSFLSTKEAIAKEVCRDLSISRATLYRKIKDFNINLNCEKNLRAEN